MTKVVNRLGQKGYLDTVRGKNGGIRLTRAPGDINIGAVVRDTEDALEILGCLHRTGYCRIESVCVLRGVVHDAADAFLAIFDRCTLADLIQPRAALASLLLDRVAVQPHRTPTGRASFAAQPLARCFRRRTGRVRRPVARRASEAGSGAAGSSVMSTSPLPARKPAIRIGLAPASNEPPPPPKV